MNYLHEYKTFNSVQELNHHVKQHTNKRYYDMNETQRQVLQLISQYSVKYVGASHLRIKTIASSLGKSSRTIERAIKALVELGIVEKVSTIRRVTGGQGANIYRILPYNDEAELSERGQAVEHTRTRDCSPIAEKETANLLSYSSNTRDTELDAEQVIHESIANNTPKELIEMLSPFFYGSELYKYVGIVFKAKYRPYVQTRIEEHSEAFKACIFDVIRRFKAGYIRSLDAYMFASIRALTRRLYIESIA